MADTRESIKNKIVEEIKRTKLKPIRVGGAIKQGDITPSMSNSKLSGNGSRTPTSNSSDTMIEVINKEPKKEETTWDKDLFKPFNYQEDNISERVKNYFEGYKHPLEKFKPEIEMRGEEQLKQTEPLKPSSEYLRERTLRKREREVEPLRPLQAKQIPNEMGQLNEEKIGRLSSRLNEPFHKSIDLNANGRKNELMRDSLNLEGRAPYKKDNEQERPINIAHEDLDIRIRQRQENRNEEGRPVGRHAARDLHYANKRYVDLIKIKKVINRAEGTLISL